MEMMVRQLSRQDLQKGVDLCLENSTTYLADAEVLLQHQSYGHAIALAVYALEELGRAIMLIAAKHDVTPLDEELWRMFKRHLDKITTTLQILGHEMRREVTEEMENYVKWATPRLQGLKERGLYVDYFNDAWHSPLDQGLRQQASSFIAETRTYLEKVDSWLEPLLRD